MPKPGLIFESAINVIQSLTDNRKNPLHIGEVMACWSYLAFVENIITFEEVGLNTTINDGVKELYEDSKKVATNHKMELTKLMRQEGIPLPSSPENKPLSDPAAIPFGVKFTDDELVNTLNMNFVVAADLCAAAASQSVRTDIALMFLKFQVDKLCLGLKAKELMQKEGWLKIPPFYTSPGLPNNEQSN
ncbi:DUF3231 family protein [Lederbergia panacisoli]|uniref:DUF3231 family protein n=1 Tax=Lederbergia panacisoli TaxID=1255251 RepID=UPI00214AA5DF|nr:DUF3231 family protein [Lederbergia panacisoli]MCR2823179.1 DUF3231 family protein [Lederbergia panacisoli]